MDNEKLIRKYDKQARIYEVRRRKRSEKKWRKKLIGSAKGNVLEVGVGAGANFYFYSEDVHVTAVDFSNEMLIRAKQAAIESKCNADFILSDIEALSFPDHSFDTIVSTLTFCGYEDPHQVLKKFNKWCKKDGQILLMEHGISSNRWIGHMQTAINPLFKRFVGCYFNRDMMDILNHSIYIERVEHYILDTFHLIWAKPKLSNDTNLPT